MDHLLRGQLSAKLDIKGRFSLPSSWKSCFPTSKLVITNSVVDGFAFLDVFPYENWMELENKVNELSQMRSEVQNFRRFYLSGSQIIDLDKMQRVLVPQSLRRFANLQGEILLVGMGQKFELWSQDKWQDYSHKLVQDFSKYQQVVAELGSVA